MNQTIQKLLRTHYRLIKGYMSAGMESGKKADLIYMNANENPYEFEGLEGYNRYPEPQPKSLLEAYGKLYDTSPEYVVATRGADEAIHLLVNLFCEPHRDALITCSPTFGMYSANADAMPAEIIDVPLTKTPEGSWSLDTDGMVAAGQKSRAKMVFICSPNNPTGTTFPKDHILQICQNLKDDALVILDETYVEFSEQGSLVDALSDHPNLIILRTLSKSYAVAGIRMGCLISGDTDFIKLVQAKAMDAYPIPKPCLDVALNIMREENLDSAAEFRRTLLEDRKTLIEAFADSPLTKHIYPTDANFFLVKMHNAAGFLQHCAAQNVILRDFTKKAHIEDCIRVSIGLPEHNERLIQLLNSFSAPQTSENVA